MRGDKKGVGQTLQWGGKFFSEILEGGKTHFSYPLLDPCAPMIYNLSGRETLLFSHCDLVTCNMCVICNSNKSIGTIACLCNIFQVCNVQILSKVELCLVFRIPDSWAHSPPRPSLCKGLTA